MLCFPLFRCLPRRSSVHPSPIRRSVTRPDPPGVSAAGLQRAPGPLGAGAPVEGRLAGRAGRPGGAAAAHARGVRPTRGARTQGQGETAGGAAATPGMEMVSVLEMYDIIRLCAMSDAFIPDNGGFMIHIFPGWHAVVWKLPDHARYS